MPFSIRQAISSPHVLAHSGMGRCSLGFLVSEHVPCPSPSCYAQAIWTCISAVSRRIDNAQRIKGLHPPVTEFADGSGAAATLVSLDNDTFELAVDEYRDDEYFALKIRTTSPGDPR
ncbi:hypothetical protein [Burkholderia sp. PR2]|uniref:hypothetical protein n=1 Tax=Burkholderia sp. PR2 TaxID=3448078 RepID=UPI00402AA5F9